MKTGIIPILPLRSRRSASGPFRSDRRSSGRGRLLALLALGLAALPSAPLRAQTAPAEPAGQPEAAVPAPGEPWTLEACIRYAQQHNTEVQQRALEVERNDIELSTARYSRLPDLNASLGGDASFGRALTSDNTYRDNNQTSGSLNVSASMPLFQGMRINHQIKAGKLDLAAAVQDLERIREDVAINVMTLYLQVLYYKELVGVSRRQLELSTLQAERSRGLAAEGKEPESAVYESEALAANDRMTLTQTRNELQLALLDLSQALNRESAAGFDVVFPELDSLTIETLHRTAGSVDAVYAYAAENRPHIKAERLRLGSSEHAVDIARSALYPSLSLSGGYGTGVYSADDSKFWAQIRHNSREYVGLSLGIPIFNRRASRNNVRTAKIAVRNQQLAVTAAEQALRKEIEQAWYYADAAYAKYLSAAAALASAEVAFRYEEQKAARPSSISATPRRAWRRLPRKPCRPNTSSSSAPRFWTTTAASRCGSDPVSEPGSGVPTERRREGAQRGFPPPSSPLQITCHRLRPHSSAPASGRSRHVREARDANFRAERRQSRKFDLLLQRLARTRLGWNGLKICSSSIRPYRPSW